MPDIPTVGTQEEQKLFTEVFRHYEIATEDLNTRIKDFDKKDVLFRSHIPEENWPYRSLIFDPRIFTSIFEKTSRLFANKPRGRMLPREGGDVLKAKINNEILNFQWDENERADNSPMLAKWALMDQNARKYGASFAFVPWKYERKAYKDKEGEGKSKIYFDGPNFEPWNNRDVLVNPAYSSIKNWCQLRSYPSFQDLASTNDAARSKPVYKNLNLLRDALTKDSNKGGDSRQANYQSKNKSIKGLTDFLGQDTVYKTLEIVTEYRCDRWITFSPKHGVILRDIPNPYSHGQIPIVLLKYYPIDDDIYGLSEIEPVEKLQRSINALVCQYMDAVNMSLYAPLKINQAGGAVQMHTIQFGPGQKWMMNNPQTDVVTHDQNISGVQEFTSTYRFLVAAMQEALGEASAGTSQVVPGEEGKTATEVKDTALSRNSRDNFNQMFLSEALKKQMTFWHLMNQQFFFGPTDKQKIIQIVGKDAIKYFQSMGLDGMELSDEKIEMMSSPEMQDVQIDPREIQSPMFPIDTDNGQESKFSLDDMGQVGKLYVEPSDLDGLYDYIPDVASMSNTANSDMLAGKQRAIELLTTSPVALQLLQQEGVSIKARDLFIDYLEDLGFKNADQYFANQPQQLGGMYGGNPLDPTGAGAAQGMQPGMANGGIGGFQAPPAAMAGGQAQPGIPPTA